MTPAEVRASVAAAGDDETKLRGIIATCAELLRRSGDDDHVGITSELLPLLRHPLDGVRISMADACDAFPGPLFDEAHAVLSADAYHYVCAAAARASERRAERRRRYRKAAGGGDDAIRKLADALEQAPGGGPEKVQRLAQRMTEGTVERMHHESSKVKDAILLGFRDLEIELAKDAPSVTALRRGVERVRAQIEAQWAVLERARTFARATKPVFLSESVASMVEEARSHLFARLGGRGERVDFVADVPEDLSFHADRHAVLQALQNLLQNAVEAYPPGTARLPVRVVATAESRGTRVILRVEDEGTGMDDGVKLRPFSAFRTTKPNGSGVGLALVEKMVEEVHGGRLRVDSEPGLGTRMILEFPARQSAVRRRR